MRNHLKMPKAIVRSKNRAFIDRLERKDRAGEYLTDAAIRRNGEVHFGGKSHAQIRAKLGDKDPYTSKPDDQEGFMTNTRRFVDRDTAAMIARAAGQVPPSFNRELLSSDIDW